MSMQGLSRNVLRRSALLRTPKAMGFSYLGGEEKSREDFKHHERHYCNSRFLKVLPGLVLGSIPIVCGGLGLWQLERLRWKETLIEDLKDKLQRAPISLPRNVNLSELPNFEYRKVQLVGVWDHASTVLLGPRTHESTQGYHVVTPLLRPNGASTVLVDRGFVSEEALKSNLQEMRVEGSVEILGLIRTSTVKNAFTPDNHPEKGEWYWADVDAMAEQAGGRERGVQPVFVEAVFNGDAADAYKYLAAGIPIGRPAFVELRNMHRTYAVTWFSLAFATSVLFIQLVAKHRIQAGRRAMVFPAARPDKPTESPRINS